MAEKERKIVLASANKGKVREVTMMLADLGIQVIPLSDTSFEGEIEENGATFEENAVIKAKTVMEKLHVPVLADDSGLEIDYLDKAPGIYSARYLGHDTPYDVKNAMILEKLKDVPKEQRSARFVCAMALAVPEREVVTTLATMEGEIGYESRGENGFGYDPIFYLPQYEKSSAEISPEQKNEISHRGKALRLMKEKIKEMQDEATEKDAL